MRIPRSINSSTRITADGRWRNEVRYPREFMHARFMNACIQRSRFEIRFESTWRETSFSPRENDNLKIDRESNGESKGEGRYWKERGFIGEKGRRLDASVLTN